MDGPFPIALEMALSALLSFHTLHPQVLPETRRPLPTCSWVDSRPTDMEAQAGAAEISDEGGSNDLPHPLLTEKVNKSNLEGIFQADEVVLIKMVMAIRLRQQHSLT